MFSELMHDTFARPSETFAFHSPDDWVEFFSRVDMDGPGGCWLWAGYVHRDGYGRFNLRKQTLPAHRVAYSNMVEAVPRHLVIDHQCRNRACVNPAHLRVVTWAQNTLENNTSPFGANAAKTHCPRGHEFTPENTYRPPSKTTGRACKTCMKARNDAANERRKAEHRAAGGRGPRATRTHCPRGHPLSGDNLYINPKKGARDCKECRRRRNRESGERKAAALA